MAGSLRRWGIKIGMLSRNKRFKERPQDPSGVISAQYARGPMKGFFAIPKAGQPERAKVFELKGQFATLEPDFRCTSQLPVLS
jgi:hypothetical protein